MSSNNKQSVKQVFIRLSAVVFFISVGLASATVLWKYEFIQTSLTQQSNKALAQQNLPPVNITFDGRDAQVSGLLGDEKQIEPIIASIYQVEGVRKVENLLTLAPEVTTAVPVLSQTSLEQISTLEQKLAKLPLDQVTFQYANAALSPSAEQTLNQLADLLKQYPNIPIAISVHTEKTGTVLGQVKASHARALVVRHYLVEQGIAATRLVIEDKDKDTAAQSNLPSVKLRVLKE